ncbi:MAG: GAF domain-containing protein [Chloroflexi bacterium]|nr:GAF domain-containing protein [Chloroflexota bacterium]
MLALLRRYFLLPSFRTDDPDSWRPYYLRRIAVADLLATVAVLPLVALTLPRPLPMSGVVLFFSLAYLFSFWVSSRLPLRISARIHIVINLLFITPAIVLSGGVQSPLVIGLFVVLLTAGLLVSRPAMIRVALFLTALLTLTLVADLGRWLPASMIDNEAPWFAWLAEAAMLVLAGQRLFLYTWLIDNALHGAASELAERRHADASLRASEERQRRLFDTMPGSYIASTIDGRILLCNPAAARIFGYPLDEFMQLNARDLYPDPADRAAMVAQVVADGEVRNHEVRMRRKDGSLLDIEATLSLVRDGQGRPAGVEGTLYDVTPLKQAQAASRESEASFQRLFEELPASFIRAGLDGRILLANRAAAHLFGYSLAELHGMSVVDLYADEADRAVVVQTVLSGGAVQARESRMRRKDGAIIITALTVNLVCDAQGAPIAVEGTQYDITPMKQVEDALRQNQQLLELAQEVGNVGHFSLDNRSHQTTWSPQIYRMLGVSPAEFTPKTDSWMTFVPADEQAVVRDAMRAARENGQAQVACRLIRRDGVERQVLLALRLVRDAAGRPAGALGTLLDITALKAAEAAAQVQAERMSVYNEIGRSVATLRGLDAVFESIYAHVHRLVTLDVFLVGLYDPDTHLVSWPVIYDGGRRYAGAESVAPEAASPITRRVIESVTPALINRTSAEIAQAALGRVDRESRAAASLIYVPLVAERGCIGYLSVQSYSLNAYDAGHVELLVGVANQTATAIRNAQLFEAAAHELAERRQAEERLSVLLELARAVSTRLSLDEVLSAVHARVVQLMAADAFFAALHDAASGQVTFPYLSDGGIRYTHEPARLSSRSNLAQAIRTGWPVLVNRTVADVEQGQPLGDPTRLSASLICVPLVVEGRTIGALSAQSYEYDRYTPAHVDLLMGIAYQAAVAIRNAQLFEAVEHELSERRQAEERLRSLAEIGRQVSSMRNLDEMVEMLYVQVQKLLPLDIFLVGLADETQSELRVPVVFDAGRRYPAARVPLDGRSNMAQTYATGTPYALNRTPEDVARAVIRTMGDTSRMTASVMHAPLATDVGIIGLVSVQSYDTHVRYGEPELDLLGSIANQIASALRSAQLFDAAQAELAERRQAEARLRALSEIGREVSSMRSLDGVLEAIYAQVKQLMPVDIFVAALYNPERETFRFPLVYDDDQRYQSREVSKADLGAAAPAVLSGQPTLVLRTPAEVLRVPPRVVGNLGRQPASVMDVPIMSEHGVIGLLGAHSYRFNAFTNAHLDWLTGIANQTAVAIRNAQLFESAEKELIERRQAEERLSVLAEISREVSSIHTLDTVLEAIYTQVKRLMPADIFAVSLFDATRSVLRYPLFYDGDRRYETPDLPLDRLSAAMHAVVASRQPMRILRTPDEVRNAPPRITGDLNRQPASLLYAPLPGEPDTIGMLGVHSYSCNAFTATHLELLTGIANQTAVAIRNAQLFESAEKELIERRQAEERLSVVAEISREVSSIHNLDTALEAIYHRVRRVLPADVFLIGFDDAATHEIEWTTIYDGGVRYPPLRMPKSTMPLATRAMQSGEPVFLHRTPAEIAAAHPRVIGDPHHKPASLLFAPLITDRSTIGVMSVQSYAPDAYSPARAELLGGIANQAAAALRSAQLFDSAAHELAERRQAEERLSALLELSRAVSTRRSLEEVMVAVHAQIQQLMPVDALFVALYDAVRDQVTFPYLSDGGQRYQRAPDPLDNSTLLAQTIRSGQPMLLKRTPAEVAQAVSRRMGDRARASASLIYLPLVVEGHTIGALSVQSYEYDRYTASHVDLLMGIAYQSAVAIRNAELFESAQQELAERRQAEERLSNLLELSREVSMHRKLDDVLEAARVQLTRLIPHDVFFVSLYDPQKAEFSFPVVIDRGVRYATPSRLLDRNSLSARVVASRAPIFFSDGVPTGPDTPPAMRLGDLTHVAQSIIVAPLALESRVFGVISVQSYEPKRYTVADVSLLVGVAYQVAIAIESARLFEALEAELAERRRAAAERETLISQLEDRNSELERFTYTVSHDLKSPLITMRGFLGYVEQDARAGQWERLQQDMRRINDATGKMQRLLDELLEMSRVGRQMNAPEDVPFETVAREAVALVGGRLAERNVVVQIAPDLPVVHGDRLRLVEVVQNLVDNAAKFMGSQAAPRIEIGARMTDAGRPVFTVRDNGIGIDPRYQARVFGLFDKLDARSEGTGVGLALVKRIIEVHGGRIWVESEGPGHGSTFCFTLPAPPASTERED